MATTKRRGGLHGERRPACQPASREGAGCDAQSRSEHAKLSEAGFYGSLDLLQDYWKCPLAPDAQEIITIATPGGLYTRARGAQLHGLGGRCDLLGIGRD